MQKFKHDEASTWKPDIYWIVFGFYFLFLLSESSFFYSVECRFIAVTYKLTIEISHFNQHFFTNCYVENCGKYFAKLVFFVNSFD